MPIYEFGCSDCGKRWESLVRSYDDRSTCPQCGSVNAERLLSTEYSIRMESSTPGSTCCGRSERCDAPPCSTSGACRRD